LGISTFGTNTTAGQYTLQVASAGAPAVTPVQTAMQPVTQAAAIPMPGNTMPSPAPSNVVGDIAQPGQPAQINVGESRRGRLQTGDQRMNDGTWADLWTFQGRQGQRIRIECRSEEFDTYLQLLDGQNSRLAEDDDSLGEQNSLIEIALPAT